LNPVSPDRRFCRAGGRKRTGHTPGHIALLVSSGKEALLNSADTVHHHVLMFAHPEWTSYFDSDPKMAAETRRKLLDRASADGLRVLGYHLPFPDRPRAGRQGGRIRVGAGALELDVVRGGNGKEGRAAKRPSPSALRLDHHHLDARHLLAGEADALAAEPESLFRVRHVVHAEIEVSLIITPPTLIRSTACIAFFRSLV